MNELANWDWDTKEKLITDINKWKKKFSEVREPVISDDGEKIATVVQAEDGKFTTCINGEAWNETFDRVWSLKFKPDNQLVCLVYKDFEWAVAIDKNLWEEKFDYIWNMQFTPDGRVAANIKKGDDYGVLVEGKTWENGFVEARDLVLSPDGTKTASAVSIKRIREGDVFGFQEGVWTMAVDGMPWDKKFLNVWRYAFSHDSQHLVAEVRLNLYDYTIAVDGKTWEETFSCVWEPVFKPGSYDVVAPVRTPQGWTLAMNGKPVWGYFAQLWGQKYSPDGKRIAAIVAPKYGKWTIAVDDSPWVRTFSDTVLPPVFSPDSKRVAAVAKESKYPFHMQSALHNIPGNDRWTIAVDGIPWAEDFDMAWDPIFSPGSDKVVTKVEKNGRYFIAIDGRVGRRSFDALWNPVFSPDGGKLLIRCIEGGKYYRRIVPIGEI